MLRKLPLAMVLSMVIVLVYGASHSKAEAELQDKLAASESARTQALKDKAMLSAAIERLTKARVEAAATAGAASQDAAIAQQTAESTAELIAQAASAASAAAVVAQSQASKFNSSSMTLIYVQGIILIGIFAGFVNSALISGREHKWAVAAAEQNGAALAQTRSTMLTVVKNTDGIKDALVKVTGEKAYAEGVKDGEEAAACSSPGHCSACCCNKVSR